ncbi:MAG: T9SS type A sorting domain-containing protein [Bacteroidota bacterium]
MRAFIYPICLFLFLASQLSAQRMAFPSSQGQRSIVGLRGLDIDTLTSPTLFEACSEMVFILEPTGDDADGYVAGTNNFLDKEKAIFLTYAGGVPFTVTEVVAYFFPADDAAINDRELVAFISEAEADGSPGELLAESEPIAVRDLNVEEGVVLPTIFTFSEPVDMSSDEFFVSIDFTDIYESPIGNIGLWMTDAGCAYDPNPSWELWEDFSWHNIEDTDTWQEEREWLIGAVVEAQPASTVDQGRNIDLKIGPNPSFGQITIEYEQDRAGRLQVEILTSGSTKINTFDLGRQAAGTISHQLDLSALPDGMYFLRLIGDGWIKVESIVVD